MAKRHWIAMSGDHGCLPDFCCACSTRDAAIETLADVFDDVRGVRAGLLRYLSHELPHGSGAEYCEIVACDCDDPAQHCDDGYYAEDGDE
jgi:hypothetical protein